MSKISSGYKYWTQYEGVPDGEMDSTDFWYASADTERHPIVEPQVGDLPTPEWMAFGDQHSPDMTVLGFGRENKDKFLSTIQTFSIGFVNSTEYSVIEGVVREVLE